MKGFERKCLMASAFTHGMLVVLVVVGSAFVSRKPVLESPSIELVDVQSILVDTPNIATGGNPNAITQPDSIPQPAPAAPKEATAPPIEQVKVPEPVKAAPKKAVEQPQPEPPKEVEKPARKTEPEPVPKAKDPEIDWGKVVKKTAAKTEKAPLKPEKAVSEFRFDQQRTIKPSKEAREAKEAAEAEENARGEREKRLAQARAGALSDALKRVAGGLSHGGTTIDVPGPGGAAYASYGLALKKFYQNAWIPPTAARSDEPVVEVEVVIGRDGTILAQRITKKSGRRELDNSVQSTLNRVFKAKAPKFPEGSADEKRTFRINFNLTEKLSVG